MFIVNSTQHHHIALLAYVQLKAYLPTHFYVANDVCNCYTLLSV